MRILPATVILIVASSVYAGEVHVRRELSRRFRYDYSALKSDELTFELQGWYLKYVEPGFRGEKTFNVRGNSKNTLTDGKEVTSVTNLEIQKESSYWSLPHGTVKCISKNSFKLSDFVLKESGCEVFASLLRFIHSLSYSPITWPSVMETYGGPAYFTPVSSQLLLTGLTSIDSGEGQHQWTIMNVQNNVYEIDITGRSLIPSGEALVRGKLFWDPVKKLFTGLDLYYTFPDTKNFPKDRDRLTALKVKIYR